MGLIQDLLNTFGADIGGRKQAALSQQIRQDFDFAESKGIDPALVVKHYRERGVNIPDVPSLGQRLGGVRDVMGPSTTQVPTGRMLTGPSLGEATVGMQERPGSEATISQAIQGQPLGALPGIVSDLFAGGQTGVEPSGAYPRREPIERVPVLGPETTATTRPARGVYAAFNDPTTPKNVLGDLLKFGPVIEGEQAKAQELQQTQAAKDFALRQSQAARQAGNEDLAVLWEASALNPKLADLLVKMQEAGYQGMGTPLRDELKSEPVQGPVTPERRAAAMERIAIRQAEEKAKARFGDGVYYALSDLGVRDFRPEKIDPATLAQAKEIARAEDVKQSGRRIAEGQAVLAPYIQQRDESTEARTRRLAEEADTRTREREADRAARAEGLQAQRDAAAESRQATRDELTRQREIDREGRREAITIAQENRKLRDELVGADAVIDEIATLSKEVNTFGPTMRAIGAPFRSAGASLQTNEAATRLQQQGAYLPQVLRGLHQKGALSDKDLAIGLGAIPTIHDINTVADSKIGELKAIIKRGYDRIEERTQETGAVRAPTTPAPPVAPVKPAAAPSPQKILKIERIR